MKRPAVFFDRDNTLIACDGYLGDPDQVQLIAGAADAVARARMLGYATVIFSNQSGVARGLFDEEAVHAVNARLASLLLDEDPGAVLDDQQYCPYHPRGTVPRYAVESELRKPKPGMLLAAQGKLALDLSRSWVIGDAPRDIEAGHAAGCRTILFNDPGVARSPAAMEMANVHPDYICGTLAEAMDYISDHPDPPDNEEQLFTEPADTVPSEESQQKPQRASDPPRALDPQRVPAAHRVPDSYPAPAVPISAPALADAMAAAAPSAPSQSAVPSAAPQPVSRLEQLLEALLQEHRRGKELIHHEFSVTKLLGGIVQIIALAALFYAYLARESALEQTRLLWAVAFETLTIALLIMGQQR